MSEKDINVVIVIFFFSLSPLSLGEEPAYVLYRKHAEKLFFFFLMLLVNYSIPPQVKWQCHKGVCIKLLNAAHNSLGGKAGVAYMHV